MQWRQPPDRVNHLRGDLVEFGRGRSRARGYLARSDRVGPGVLILDPHGHERADALNGEGFTALVPDLELEGVHEGAIVAAAEYLSDNWHPRLGVIAVGSGGAEMAHALVERGVTFDLLVLYGALWPGEPLPPMPVLGHFFEGIEPDRMSRFADALVSQGREPELYTYPIEGAHAGAEAIELADARTLDALVYLLS